VPARDLEYFISPKPLVAKEPVVLQTAKFLEAIVWNKNDTRIIIIDDSLRVKGNLHKGDVLRCFQFISKGQKTRKFYARKVLIAPNF
jgi:hypothetical protein